MKKFLMVISFLGILSFLFLPVAAAPVGPDGQGGIYVSDNIKSEFRRLLKDGDEIIGTLGSLGTRDAYIPYDRFADVFRGVPYNFLIRQKDGSIKFITIKDPAGNSFLSGYTLFDITDYGYYECILDLLASPEQVLSKTGFPATELPAVFVFSDAVNCAIYFQIEDKEYVYMRDHSSEKEYLLYADTYLKYIKWDRSEKGFLWDLSAYDINSPDFDLDAPTPDVVIHWIGVSVVVAVVAGALVLGFIIRRRKKRRAQTV